MPEELKPCPACNEPSPEISNTGRDYYVRCPHCCMRGPEAGGPTWAAEDWNAMPRRLRWTKETPTEPGWYWNRREGHPEEMTISWYSETRLGNLYTDGKDLWAGPIPEPEE